MVEHTKGPWKANTFSVLGGHNYRDRITHVGGFLPPARVGEAVANARLIAAAPELLAALENLVAVGLGHGGTKPNAYGLAEAAIAKARGETHD